jgi:glutamate-1-semialdehyde aminotransferase
MSGAHVGVSKLIVPWITAWGEHGLAGDGDLELLDSNPDIGVLILEVMMSIEPAVGYLEAIREKCNKNGIVLIFDECTSGFRETYGGLHLKFGITPDLATFGKALGNGYAITALIGKSTVMSSVEDTFMSSTFWSERTGYVAALASLKAMATLQSWEKITQIGLKMRNIWSESFIDTGIDFSFSGIPALSALQFHGPNGNAIKTLITQEMLKENILASNIFYPSIAHTEIHLEQYRSALQEVILKITKNKSTPRKPLGNKFGKKWKSTTANIAIPLSPCISSLKKYMKKLNKKYHKKHKKINF